MILEQLNKLLILLQIDENHLPELKELEAKKEEEEILDLEILKKKNYFLYKNYLFCSDLHLLYLDLGHCRFMYLLTEGNNEYLKSFYLILCNLTMCYSNYLQFLIENNKQETINEHIKKIEFCKDVLFELDEKLLKDFI